MFYLFFYIFRFEAEFNEFHQDINTALLDLRFKLEEVESKLNGIENSRKIN